MRRECGKELTLCLASRVAPPPPPINTTTHIPPPLFCSMLDVSRHFVSVPSILDVIDLMAYDKMNVLHLHLIDTQSWPIVVPGFPRLSQWGAYANYSHIYTPADIERIVTFAKYRGVRVVPGKVAVRSSFLRVADHTHARTHSLPSHVVVELGSQ